MKKVFVLMALALFIAVHAGTAFSNSLGATQEQKQNGWGPGPAPNSGDGVPDGSGFRDDGSTYEF